MLTLDPNIQNKEVRSQNHLSDVDEEGEMDEYVFTNNSRSSRRKRTPRTDKFLDIFDTEEQLSLLGASKPLVGLEGLDHLTKGSDSKNGSDCDTSSSFDDNIDPIYRKHDIITVLTEISKIAIPAMVSAMLGQITYIINVIYAGEIADSNLMAGLGLGHCITQALGITIYLGFNSRLATIISQAYGVGNLQLCGQYVNEAHWQNLCLFIPISFVMATIAIFFTQLGQSPEVASIAATFIFAGMPHVFFTQMFDV